MRVLTIGLVIAALHGALRYLANEFARHGYAILFGLVAGESFWLPLPGELSLLAAGYEASRGKLNVFWVAGAGIAAAIVGDNLAYLIGRLAGPPLIARLARLLHLHTRRAETMNDYFDRHSGKTIVTARWISPLRGLVALSAGAAHVRWRRFLVFNAIGSVTWAASVTALAYGLSRSLGEVADIFNVTGLAIAGVLVVGVVVFFLWRHGRRGVAVGGGVGGEGSSGTIVRQAGRAGDEPSVKQAARGAGPTATCEDPGRAVPVPAACGTPPREPVP